MAFLREIATLAASRGATLLIVGDTPRMLDGGDGEGGTPACLTPDTFARCATPRTRAWYLGWTIQASDHPTVVYARNLRDTFEQRLTGLDTESAAVRYISSEWMFDRICDPISGLCGPNAPGTNTVIYYDDHHLSTAGAVFLAPFINCQLAQFGLLS